MFGTGSHYVVVAGPELAMQTRMALTLSDACVAPHDFVESVLSCLDMDPGGGTRATRLLGLLTWP